jgi:hypothetical protein
MGKRAKILVIAASIAAVLALSVVGVAAAASPNNPNDNVPQYGQQAGFGQGICSEAVRNLLGMTTDQIQALRNEGKSLVQIAATKGITEQQLINAITAERQADIQAKVVAGTLTQERANIMLQQMQQNVVRAINRTTVGKPEWAGANGIGQGACNGQLRNQKDGNGLPGLGAGPGNAHKWGRAS